MTHFCFKMCIFGALKALSIKKSLEKGILTCEIVGNLVRNMSWKSRLSSLFYTTSWSFQLHVYHIRQRLFLAIMMLVTTCLYLFRDVGNISNLSAFISCTQLFGTNICYQHRYGHIFKIEIKVLFWPKIFGQLILDRNWAKFSMKKHFLDFQQNWQFWFIIFYPRVVEL